MRNRKTTRKGKPGFTFTRVHQDIDKRITHEDVKKINNCDVTWWELLDEFMDFLRGCGFRGIPEGEIEFIKEDEIVVKKTEAILYAKEKMRKSKLEEDEDIPF